jgi:outer membrane protein assembly factor BamB
VTAGLRRERGCRHTARVGVCRLAMVFAILVLGAGGANAGPHVDGAEPAAAAAAKAPAAGPPVAVEGIVFVDEDGDGVPDVGEAAVADAVVVWERSVFVRTDAGGRYRVPPVSGGIVWVRVPDGFVPGPVWRTVPAGAKGATVTIDLGLRRAVREGPLTFVVAADTHMSPRHDWDWDDLAQALEGALALEPRPAFFTIVGDLAQGSDVEIFRGLRRVGDAAAAPFVPVPGNHDWYDDGTAYREVMGPDDYSFDAGGVHFVVLNGALPAEEVVGFLRRDAEFTAPGQPVIGLLHQPPSDAMSEALRRGGVDDLFTGHWHANRVVDHGGMREYNTEPFLMGGLDFTPAGYRIVTVEAGGLRVEHRTVTARPIVAVVAPTAEGCVAAGPVELLVDVALDASRPRVTAHVDGGAPLALAPVGGWVYGGRTAVLAPGPHRVEVTAVAATGAIERTAAFFTVCEVPAEPGPGGEWAQLQGGPTHQGRQAQALRPPLTVRWSRAVGGHVYQGSPVVAGGLVFVGVSDLADGSRGGVVAIDLESGEVRWERRLGDSVRSAPAVADGIVVVGTVDGVLHGLDAASGADRWQYDLGSGTDRLQTVFFAAPTIADGVVYAGLQTRFAAVDLATGRPRWQLVPCPEPDGHGDFASVAVGGGLAVGVFHRELGGLIAADVATGKEIWRNQEPAIFAVNASPVIDGDRIFVADGATIVDAIDRATGEILWERQLDERGFWWGFASSGTPAYGDGILVVPTLYGVVYGLDAATGDLRWRVTSAPGPLHPTHYRGAGIAAFAGAPIITGGVVWIGGADGILYAIDLALGNVLWKRDLGTPILAGAAAAGDQLIVATWDGTVRALGPANAGPARLRSAPSPLLALLALVYLAFFVIAARANRRS